MKFLKNTIGFMALFAALPALAVTARPSVTGAAASRLPTATAQRASAVSYAYTTASSLLDNSDCISAYTSCVKDSSVCGEKFEKCTNTVEFQGKMAACLDTLMQCDASGINALFGTSNTAALGTIKAYKQNTKNKEVSEYAYPTTGSVLGQMITSGYVASRLDTQSCIKQYTNCLRRESVCGEDFELCTSNSEFKKQRLLCDNVLSRCQSDGVIALFKGESTSQLDNPAGDSRVGEMITDGAASAALNAVAACYKKVNVCIEDACKKNPYKCKAGVETDLTAAADNIITLSKNDGTTTGDVANALSALVDSAATTTTNSTVKKYISSVCKDTISQNASCMAVFALDGKTPNKSELNDENNRENTWENAYDDRITKVLPSMLEKWLEEFDTTAKSKCVDAISECALSVCGGGNGAACYVSVFGNGTDRSFTASINGESTYDEIKAGCASVINTDQNCIYSAMNRDRFNSFSYAYSKDGTFDILFAATNNDPIGAVAALNKDLSEKYNDASIKTAKQICQNSVKSCIAEKCGTDYVSCYRNRSDIMSNLTNATYIALAYNKNYDEEMNKVGGVLDATIVLGLCLDTVKNNASCDTHLAVETQGLTSSGLWKNGTNSNYTSVQSAWLGSGAVKLTSTGSSDRRVTDASGNLLCGYEYGDYFDTQICGTTVNGKTYNIPRYEVDFVKEQAAEGIFSEVLSEVEKEVQAIYNAKLTTEQNACFAKNKGGIRGSTAAAYAWVKLTGGVPSDYDINGLSDSDIMDSNEIYNSFCRVRVKLQSDDSDVQEVLAGLSPVYFATGDIFTCGSWLDNDTLTKLSQNYANKKTGTNEKGKLKDGQILATVGVSLLGGGLSAWGFDALQSKTGLGGLMKTTNSLSKKNQETANKCLNEVDAELSKWKNFQNSHSVNAQNIYEDYELKFDTNISGLKNQTLQRLSYTYKAKVEGKSVAEGIAANTVEDHILDLERKRETVCGINDKVNTGGRIAVDVVGAALGGTATGIATWQAMQAVNKKKYTEAEQEWMDNIGSKIYCVVDGNGTNKNKLGTFGDLMTNEL